MKVKVESEKVGLKLNIQKTKIMASGPITSWESLPELISHLESHPDSACHPDLSTLWSVLSSVGAIAVCRVLSS